MAEHYYVYVLISEAYNKTYTGCTADIEKRLLEHNHGSNAYSRKYKPWKLIYSEEFSSKAEALKRERYLKSHAGRRFLQKIIANIPR